MHIMESKNSLRGKKRRPRHVHRVVVCGAGAVGKSAITVRYIQGQFMEKYDPTIEDSYNKDVVFRGLPHRLDIMDTAGQEEYRALTDTYMKRGDAFLVVFSVASRTSFEFAKRTRDRVLDIQARKGEPVVICMVANKIDLVHERCVDEQEARGWATEEGLLYAECSAKTGQGISEIFDEIMEEITRTQPSNEDVAPGKKNRCALS